MRRNAIFRMALVILTGFVSAQASFACTDFMVKAQDGTVLIARSMEYGLDLQSNLRTSPRNRQFTMAAPSGKPGLSWQAKYGYVYLDGLNTDVAVDGMNEAGLSIEDLYLPDFANYQTVPAGQDANALPYLNFGDWVLSNFKTVDEVRQALPKIYVYAQKLPQLGDLILPLHYAIYDATGKGLVVEYIGGKLYTYDSIGVMTNSPSYDWHVTNLSNYLQLSPYNPPAALLNGQSYFPHGNGFGLVGLPGDYSPPARFIKIATLLRIAMPVADGPGALNLAQHIINNVDMPLGAVRATMDGKEANETAQWTVFKDLTHLMFYYRTYGDTTLRSIALAKINFNIGAPHLKMPVANAQLTMDMTDDLIKTGGASVVVETLPVVNPRN